MALSKLVLVQYGPRKQRRIRRFRKRDAMKRSDCYGQEWLTRRAKSETAIMLVAGKGSGEVIVL